MAFSQPLFAIRGTQLKPYYSTGASQYSTVLTASGSSQATVDANANAGVFGSSVLNFSYPSGSSGYRYMRYCVAGGSAPSSGAFSFLMRIVPGWTGTPSTEQDLFEIGDVFPGTAVNAYINTSGKLAIEVDCSDPTTNDVSVTTGSALSFTSGTPTDIMITWDGSATAGSVKVYQDGTLFASLNPTHAATGWQQATMMSMTIGETYHDHISTNVNYTLNEFCIFDSVQAAYAVRSAFIPTSNLNGDTLPSVNDTRNGVPVGLSTGNCVVPTTGQVQSGVTFDTSSSLTGTLAVPATTDVRHGTTYGANTGSAYIPAATDVRHAVNVDATTGSAYIPLAADVRHGTNVDATTGTAYIPTAANVRSGTNTDATAGTLAVPTPAQVLLGVSTDNTTGTRDDALPATVLNNIVYAGGAKTGTLSLATSSQAAAILAVLGVANSDIGQLIFELWQTAGLDSANPMTVTPTKRTVAAITMDLSGDGVTSTTVARQ